MILVRPFSTRAGFWICTRVISSCLYRHTHLSLNRRPAGVWSGSLFVSSRPWHGCLPAPPHQKSVHQHAQCEEAAKSRSEYLTNHKSCLCLLLQLGILVNNRSHEVARFGYCDCILFSFALRKLSFRAAITIFSSRVYYLFVSRLLSFRLAIR